MGTDATKISCSKNNEPVEMVQVSKVKVGDKTYTVTVTLVPIPEKEAKIKRSIVEAIMKKAYLKGKLLPKG